MKRPSKKEMRRWRPLLAETSVRTIWAKGSWVTEQSWNGQVIFSEQLALPRWASALRVATEELRSVCTAAPPLSPSGVHVDHNGRWSVRIACPDCQSFLWPLPLLQKHQTGLRGEWERAVARLLAYRWEDYFLQEECPGCFDQKILEDDPSLHQKSFYWFSIVYQDWYLRLVRNGVHQDLPLYLPAWAPQEEVRRKVLYMMRGDVPYDWERS